MLRISRTRVGCRMASRIQARTLQQPVTQLISCRMISSTAETESADLGFAKSSKASIQPTFTPFDASTAGVEAQARTTYFNLWSLLEACLNSGYMDRAFSILQSLYENRMNGKFFIRDYNEYFLKYSSQVDNIDALQEKLFNDLNKVFKDVSYDDRTLSILLHKSLNSMDKNMYLNCKKFLSMNINGHRSVLKNMDVLTVADYSALCNEMKMVDVSEVPESVRSIIENSTDDLNSLTNSGEKGIETLKKNAVELKSVDTFGMKTVRISLQGLSLSPEQRERIDEYLSDPKLNPIVSNSSQKGINFFEIFKNLKTKEDKEAFNEFLDMINIERQRELENRSFDASKERWKYEFDQAASQGGLKLKKNMNVRLWEWYQQMLPVVKQEIALCQEILEKQQLGSNKQNVDRAKYGPYLLLVPAEKMCVITILELLKLQSSGGVTEGMRTARAVLSVGRSIEMEFRSEKLLRSENKMFKEVNKRSHEFKMFVQNAKTALRNMHVDENMIQWPSDVKAKIGSILVSMLIHVARVTVEGIDPITKEKVIGDAPAFCHTFQYRSGTKIGILKIHRSLVNQLSAERMTTNVQPQHLPMLVRPRPWTNWNSGGYNYSQSVLIRSRDSPEQIAYIKAVSEQGSIQNVYEGLNVLGNTAWTINEKLFNVISEVWNTGEEFLDIPPLQDKLELPAQPPRSADPLVLKEWRNKCRQLTNEFKGFKSYRCDSNYKLEIARAFLGEKFYFPHNMDFRGRAYPLAPHFNHLGNDMTRSLLIFWNGKRLGENGLKWLKIHLANLYGMDKSSFEERVAFANAHFDDIKDSAENPLGGKRWWTKADKPWQLLATCIELNEAMKLDNPEDFISHQPVHQDGTCNGLQHYAALGGDIEGARQVNLVPSDRPQDVYAFVAKLVSERLRKAAEAGDESALKLKDLVSRKVVKRTVMTNVYGVTFVGAADQIMKELDGYFDNPEESNELSRYLAKHVFASIRELFHAAHLIQDWLGECAKKISKSIRLDFNQSDSKTINSTDLMTSVIWTSPLGLPVVQPYRDLKKKQVQTNLQTVFITDPFAINPINPRRQQAGLPPNFIHSLDASHMLLSAIQCGKAGLDFAAVHDSYWTHACDVDDMNFLLRQEFINLHKIDLIERLKNEFDERYRDYLEIVKIRRDSDLGKKILEIRSEFAKKEGRNMTIADEIKMEKMRVDLLRSEDPEEQRKGREMVTSVSCTLDYDIKEEENKTKNKVSQITILTPLRLPEIPPKGNFDVEELMNSKYFFS
ncbi:DNA-directed RNA polymerase [Kluyveromyces marxianus]|uniref:DNA-directed RNA polymerase n=1 Tax=Kluyveromyces marxianus (strain DMKU3-1042 / BCC 29191 / NBRC 104275) TaxID=1003335 RepID=W0TGI8_KLUMD|nr:DNA-directed RNA polymerase [Kluyveromyces marxianus DMKU3-1042]BAO41906.1 DNA-directed RNA polymerase [Kluyveromyces marxianus DMKU3-1042]BAP73332.1 DNA-directed RNA polymerase [Kluyveromyces marxianus]